MALDSAAFDASPPARRGRNVRSLREAGLIAIIVVIFVAMTFASPYFLTWANMRAMLLSFAIDGIVVVGMTILLIVGGIDLSVGSVVCLSMAVAGYLFLAGFNPWIASLLGIGAAALVGVCIAFCVTVVGLTYFIASLAFMVIARGASMVITQGTPLSLYSLPESFKFVGQGVVGGVPFVILIFVFVAIVFDVLMRRAVAFRRIFYTGSNEQAAAYSGISVSKVKFAVTVLCSTMAGLAGVIYMARFGAATPTFGVGMELNIIAAAVIGGASLEGGVGSVLGAVLGIGLLSTVSSSLILLNVSVYWQDMIRGFILLGAVTIDYLLTRSRA
jgi:ribose transport system permease protein